MSHTHNVKGNVDSAGSHTHNLLVYTGNKAEIYNVYGNSLLASNRGLTDSYAYRYNPTYGGTTSSPYIQSDGSHTHPINLTSGDSSKSNTDNNSATLKSNSFSILTPYEVAYCWKRTA